jgi:hypothetical protein
LTRLAVSGWRDSIAGGLYSVTGFSAWLRIERHGMADQWAGQ